MNPIAIYALTSALHDPQTVAALTEEFLSSLHISYDWKGDDYSDFGDHDLNLIYVRTGGTEGIFQQLLPQLIAKSDKPFYLLASDKSNSLAASMEILSYLQQRGLQGEILHGDAKYSEESFTSLLELKARLAKQAEDSVCGHFQWIFISHDNPGRVQPDGAYRRIDKIGPINYKGLATIWEEPTPAYYMYRQHYAPQFSVGSMPNAPQFSVGSGFTAADRNVNLLKGADGYHYLDRINCGGDAFTDEFGQLWQADDSIISHSWGQDFPDIHPFQASQRHITTDIRGTKSDELFQFFRFGRHRLWYDLDLSPLTTHLSPQTDYRIELYFTEPWHGRGGGERDDYEGLRIFDVAVNDSVIINDLDPWAEAGYCGALKLVVTAHAKNGRLHISFPEVKAGQAVICGIAVAALSSSVTTNTAALVSPSGDDRGAWLAFDTDTIAKLPKEELPQDTEARPATIYQPVRGAASPASKKATSFLIKPGLGQEYALRFRYKNTTGAPVKARMTITDMKHTVLVDRDITFPPTPDKFKMLSTTTGTQINAGTYTVRIDNKDIVFKELEIQ